MRISLVQFMCGRPIFSYATLGVQRVKHRVSRYQVWLLKSWLRKAAEDSIISNWINDQAFAASSRPQCAVNVNVNRELGLNVR